MFTHNSFDKEVEAVLEELSGLDRDSEEYRKTVENLKVLCEARGVKNPSAPSIDTVLSVAANIIGILLVLNFERSGTIVSKAFTGLFRPR